MSTDQLPVGFAGKNIPGGLQSPLDMITTKYWALLPAGTDEHAAPPVTAAHYWEDLSVQWLTLVLCGELYQVPSVRGPLPLAQRTDAGLLNLLLPLS